MKNKNSQVFLFTSICIAIVMCFGLYIEAQAQKGYKAEEKSAYSVGIAGEEDAQKSASPDKELTGGDGNSDGEDSSGITELKKTDLVYITKSGKKFHIKNDCGKMNPENAESVSVEAALEKGLLPCKRCLKDAVVSD